MGQSDTNNKKLSKDTLNRFIETDDEDFGQSDFDDDTVDDLFDGSDFHDHDSDIFDESDIYDDADLDDD